MSRRAQVKKVKEDIKYLELNKTGISNLTDLLSGIELLTKHFNLTENAINSLSRSLMVYSGDTMVLKEQKDNLKNLYYKYLDEKKLQVEMLNKHNFIMKERNEKTTTLLTTNDKFIFEYHSRIAEIIEEAHLIAIKILYLAENKKSNLTIASKYLPYKCLSVLESNMQKYSELFTFENILRQYILIKYKDKYGTSDLSKWLKQSYFDDYSSRKNDESKYGISSRGDNILYYLDFDKLAQIIETNFKDGFQDDFKRMDDIVQKLKYLYFVRCKVAHNSLCITEDEYKISQDFISIISKHITTKYKKAINFH